MAATPDNIASESDEARGEGNPVTPAEFQDLMEALGFTNENETIAVAVSGGPDSMALSCLAKTWSEKTSKKIVGLTVDHHLREESARETVQVNEWFQVLGMDHHTLEWQGGEVVGQMARSPQAAARDARFDLIITWCKANGVKKVLIAHHADDQAETFLQRLVRGSGLDGLAAMQPVTERGGVTLMRPLLTRSKEDLLATCEACEQPWIADPSNQDDRFSRVRMRKLLAALNQEGLEIDRLLNTVAHLQRAKDAIDFAVETLIRDNMVLAENGSLQIGLEGLRAAPEEVGLRCLARCLCQVSGAHYPPRFESLTQVYQALASADWSDRTLHGCQLRLADGVLTLALEAKERQNSA